MPKNLENDGYSITRTRALAAFIADPESKTAQKELPKKPPPGIIPLRHADRSAR